jgi:hypothetical protein
MGSRYGSVDGVLDARVGPFRFRFKSWYPLPRSRSIFNLYLGPFVRSQAPILNQILFLVSLGLGSGPGQQPNDSKYSAYCK